MWFSGMVVNLSPHSSMSFRDLSMLSSLIPFSLAFSYLISSPNYLVFSYSDSRSFIFSIPALPYSCLFIPSIELMLLSESIDDFLFELKSSLLTTS